jgi:hypothetical protein
VPNGFFPACPLDRLSRYEQRLWRQARQIILTLKTLVNRNDKTSWPKRSLSAATQRPFILMIPSTAIRQRRTLIAAICLNFFYKLNV